MSTALPIETDALVIGAGPVGLFQVFQLGLQGLRAQVVDTLPEAGGQCLALYPDKPIYDIPGIPRCTGRELVAQLLTQLAPFAPGFHFGQEICQLQKQADGRWLAETTASRRFLARTVFIAAGVGAFVPRTLRIDGLAPFEGRQVHYNAMPDAGLLAGQKVLIMGGDASAVQAAVTLASAVQTSEPAPRQVTLLHRKDAFEAEPNLLHQLQQLRQSGQLRVQLGQPIGIQTHATPQGERLTGLQVATDEDTEHTLPLDSLLAYLGLSPRLGPLAHWGLAMERKLLSVDPATFSTAEPGLFAVGDINHYPGKRKLILCGFHEATLAAFAAAALVHPEQPVRLQYTTTSTLLQQRLGVTP
ncbi:MAG: NAD(P)/FAD-dependent oxidoreductase [Curvibacter sp.]|nr:MAG: NAD(P)/FAD-dependent oxidoreductase [Curvibacter sp.]